MALPKDTDGMGWELRDFLSDFLGPAPSKNYPEDETKAPLPHRAWKPSHIGEEPPF